jgi:transporter family-2 protein
MLIAMLMALVNGFLIGINRVLNAALSQYIGAMGSSIWNHLVGFLFLAVLFPFTGDFDFLHSGVLQHHSLLLLGGVLGAGFVAANSLVIPKLGVTQTVILVIAGQMITGTVIDIYLMRINSPLSAILGVSLIMVGIVFGQLSRMEASEN